MVETGTLSTGSKIPQGVVVSVLVHVVFAVLLLSIAPEQLEDAMPENKIDVEIIPFEALGSSAFTLPDEDLVQPQQPAAQEADDGMIRPGKMLSSSLLAHPDNAEGRKDFSQLTEDEKHEQLCALEALEQIRAWNSAYHPLRLVSYSFAEVRYEKNRIIADGAAFWSHDKWHRLKFDCELSDDQQDVVSFAFLVGVIVPKDQWDEHNLTKYK